MKDGLGSVEDVAVAKGLVSDSGGGGGSADLPFSPLALSFLESSSDSGSGQTLSQNMYRDDFIL